MTNTITLTSDYWRNAAMAAVKCAPLGMCVVIKKRTRTTDQNSKLWPMLTDLSRQVDWYGEKLTPEEWKDVMTAALKRERVVPGIEGGFVVLGQRTSQMTKEEFSELVEVIYAFGARQGVEWSEPEEKS